MTAKNIVRRCIAALPDFMVRNLMEHAANKTPILPRRIIESYFSYRGAG